MNNEDIYTVITPGRLYRKNASFQYRVSEIRSEISTALFLIKSELKTRIFGKTTGIFALALDPFFLSFTYYVLTKVVFSGSQTSSYLELFTLVVFWQLFSKIVQNAPFCIGSNAGVLKQTNFSLRVVYFSFLGLEFFLWLVSLIILLLFLLVNGWVPSLDLVYLPFVILTQVAFSACLAFPISLFGTYLKDLPSFINPVIAMWFYLSPGLYPISKIPEKYIDYYNLNPFVSIFQSYKQVFFQTGEINLRTLLVIFGTSMIVLALQIKFSTVMMRRVYAYL